MSALESFLLTITNPTIAYILLSMGSLGLLLELYNPGAIFPGVIGGICLLLAFYALGTLPLNFAGVALLAFGLLLFGLEPFLTSHGILAAGGAVAFVMGSLLLINVPDTEGFLRVSLAAIIGVTGIFLAFFLIVVAAVIRSRRRKVVTGREGLLGATGVVRREIEPGRSGIVLTQGELWQAVADGRIGVGDRVEVVGVDGLELRVRRIAQAIPPPTPRPASPALAKSTKSKIAGAK
jgi:membrane-bound serine protease (ClpP class)